MRKAQDASLFATAYDPKSACDYVCDGLAGSWSQPGAAFQTSTSTSTSGASTGTTSAAVITSTTTTVRAASQETRASELDAVIKGGQLVLGPCCTPRLVIRVVNRSTGGDEVLGTCKASHLCVHHTMILKFCACTGCRFVSQAVRSTPANASHHTHTNTNR